VRDPAQELRAQEGRAREALPREQVRERRHLLVELVAVPPHAVHARRQAGEHRRVARRRARRWRRVLEEHASLARRAKNGAVSRP
jgi:hypothetical protein